MGYKIVRFPDRIFRSNEPIPFLEDFDNLHRRKSNQIEVKSFKFRFIDEIVSEMSMDVRIYRKRWSL